MTQAGMSDDVSLNTREWDYTQQAPYYHLRPNYADGAVDHLVRHVGARPAAPYAVVDVGAGTGNLTVMLLDRGLSCIAVEPNAAMRRLGVECTQGRAVEWRVGKGEATTLPPRSVDWFVMGSSFNTTERAATLSEAHRVLKAGGYFTCLWNHRDLTDAVQQTVERVIRSFVPAYSHGTRREPQADVILESRLFNDVHYFEEAQRVERTVPDFIAAWASVKNPYWDLATPAGHALFDSIKAALAAELGRQERLTMTYVTRTWTARRIDRP